VIHDGFAQDSNRVQRMARTLDVDLGQAVLDGRLTWFPYPDMVARCGLCKGAKDCERWMDGHASGATEAPDYCRNRGIFEALKAS